MSTWVDRIPGLRALSRLPGQLMCINPFGGDCKPTRVPLFFQFGRSTTPFPHPWNYQRPIDILASFFHGAEKLQGPRRHNRYLDMPGFAPVLVSRDPAVIRAILTETGDREGQFDRDTLPSQGIARATGNDTLLFGNGSLWRTQRKASAAPFGKTALFQIDIFCDFQETFRSTTMQRLTALRKHMLETGATSLQIQVEPEIKTLMLEMLVQCFFGTTIDYQELREKYVPALEHAIDHIVRDTVINPLGISRTLLAKLNRRYAQAIHDTNIFDELTDRVIASRHSGAGLWKKLKTDAPDSALRSNIKVFLAGALEATTSFATWAISHLARNPHWQENVWRDVEHVSDFTPENLDSSTNLNAVLEETLRLTPSLYFLPRKSTVSARVETADGRVMIIPKGTHILLDVWHANRHEDNWGEAITGFPADQFKPERWETIRADNGRSKDFLHYGFGHGARVCPGKHLGQLEVALVVGVFVKLFRFKALNAANHVKAGVSTKPADGTLVELELRPPSAGMTSQQQWDQILRAPAAP